ncbi:MAG: cytochrome-c peroxidase, partial [Bdellovibrionales bacterium]|nr:cytochrome-c peroxidase [Bdellovibrionales bacterium]
MPGPLSIQPALAKPFQGTIGVLDHVSQLRYRENWFFFFFCMRQYLYLLSGLAFIFSACTKTPEWEAQNPIKPIPDSPLGIDSKLSELPEPPTPERVRLGRWLFYDKRLSADGSVSCATCHRPENAFSEPTATSTGIRGQIGGRKAPSFVNLAWTIYPNFFWDGRAASLEEQAIGPIANPIEMGHTHEAMVAGLNNIKGYKKYFKEAFGAEMVTLDHVAKAIADYERTRLSGNSPWDKWKAGDETAVSDEVK